jgi:hypothetical protein
MRMQNFIWFHLHNWPASFILIMLSLVVLCIALIYSGQAFLFRCDLEMPCTNFTIDYNWGLTDGLHPQPIDHDHTLNTSLGHYLFYQPQNRTPFIFAQIKTTNWVQPTTERAVCFSMWYYTPRVTCPFSIQLIQGDDEELSRIVATVPGKDSLTNDWTQVNVTLPAERVKIFIRLNDTNGPLAFDDLTVDFCDGPRPLPPKILLSCNFESSCTSTLYSLPYYPYQWSTIQASDAAKQEDQAPSIDYTFGNQSGHYTWLDNYQQIEKGYVGYLATRAAFNITANETFCLNFEYYGYGQQDTGHLKVYAWNAPNEVQPLWPPQSSSQFV